MKFFKKKNENGQASVEFALMIPLIAIFLLMIVQVGLIVERKILVTNASREAARVLSVENDSGKATNKAKETVKDADISISRPSKQGEYLTVVVKDKVESSFFPDVTVSAKTTMRVEK